MECPICKEQIKEGAKKCPVCGEALAVTRKFRRFLGMLVSGAFSVAVALGSLGIAFLEYQGRQEAEQAKEMAQEQQQMAEAEKEAAESILQKINPQALQAAAQETQFDFREQLERNPQDFLNQQRLDYIESFLQR